MYVTLLSNHIAFNCSLPVNDAIEQSELVQNSFIELTSSEVRSKAAEYLDENSSPRNEASYVNWYDSSEKKNYGIGKKGPLDKPHVKLPDGEVEFRKITLRIHSHMEGQKSLLNSPPGSTMLEVGGLPDGYNQYPHGHDIETALEAPVNAVYSIPHNKVYFYNNNGIVAIISIDAFKTAGE